MLYMCVCMCVCCICMYAVYVCIITTALYSTSSSLNVQERCILYIYVCYIGIYAAYVCMLYMYNWLYVLWSPIRHLPRTHSVPKLGYLAILKGSDLISA